ncbi:hypothetical protein [Pseudomonas batumici]|uniref:Uncharacterized protein n=1 Tax=Pseudomonas batumici TaxID=226910 RepID=A0A0C2EU60_9PSED|nr:hypothetical protein [Pseudomonas batumici]KIH82168.1 hypothetical protein UCMB321_4169 [Pseudomonas batumici]
MKNDPRISDSLAKLRPNHVGLLAWSLLPHPHAPVGGIPGIPGQPDPDTPQPDEQPHPYEPNKPYVPDETPSPED